MKKLTKNEQTEMTALNRRYVNGALSALELARYQDLLDRDYAQTAFGRAMLKKSGGAMVKIIDGTICGKIGEISKLIARHCSINQRRARKLLSDACDQIEYACEGELEDIGAYDILEKCAEIQSNIADERRAPKRP